MFLPKIYHSYVRFFFNMKVVYFGFQTSCKPQVWEKSGSSIMTPKTSRTIKIQEYLNYNMSQTSWDWTWIFVCCQGMPQYAQSEAKWWISLIPRMSWDIKVTFYMWLVIHRCILWRFFFKILKYWGGAQCYQSYFMGRSCLFSLGWSSCNVMSQ